MDFLGDTLVDGEGKEVSLAEAIPGSVKIVILLYTARF